MNLLIIGAGGFGHVIADLAAQSGKFRQIQFLDDLRRGPNILGHCSQFTEFCLPNTAAYPAFGNNAMRLEWLERLRHAGIPVPTIVHPTAYVSPTVHLGTGCVILPKAIVSTDVQLHAGCVVDCGAIVDHGCILEDGVRLAPGAVVRAENRVPSCMTIDANQVLSYGCYPL